MPDESLTFNAVHLRTVSRACMCSIKFLDGPTAMQAVGEMQSQFIRDYTMVVLKLAENYELIEASFLPLYFRKKN